jgi:thymidine kinase
VAKLYFYYSAMNAGKSAHLIQSSFNYNEKGMDTLCFLPEVSFRAMGGKIASRTGISLVPVCLSAGMDVAAYVAQDTQKAGKKRACILVDEAQFLTKNQVKQLCHIVDQQNIPVLCYGLRTDFKGDLFEGSDSLLAWADHLHEIKTICFCGRKATMTLRIAADGSVDASGQQIECGGNERYVSVCRDHHTQRCWQTP